MAVDPVEAVKCVGDAVAGPAIDASTKWIEYVKTCEANVKEVRKLHKNLKSKQKEVEKKVKIGEQKNEEMVPEVQDWLKDVDTLLKDNEDWKDFFLDDEARRMAERCCFGCCWSPFYRHGLSKRAEEKAGEIKKMIKTINDRGDAVTLRSRPLKFASTTGNFCEGLKSREDKIDEILDVLRNDEANRIGIYGMGGAGKTTIAYEVARRAENEKLFNAVFMVEISQFPDYKRIQDQIAHRIDYNLDRYHDNIEERGRYLGDRLIKIKRKKRGGGDEQHGQTKGEKPEDEGDGKPKNLDQEEKTRNDDEKEGRHKGKKSGDVEKQARGEKSGKLLVILDNIWKKLDLHIVGIPYELQKDLGCKIIVISRSDDVCKSMDASGSQIFKVGDLNHDEAEYLFRKRVGVMIDKDGYKQISEKILKKCSRLPLSINVLADTLKNQTLSVWERILRQMEKPTQGEAFGVLGDTYLIIEMSYNYLGNKEKKMFFLLCCLFPLGSTVRFDDLLRYGIGLGLFQYVNSIVEAIDQAQNWTNDLKSLSLLSKVDVKKGEISIHDDVREAGKVFAAKGEYVFHVGAIPGWLNIDSYENYSIISMTSDESYKYLAGLNLPKLHLLHCHGASCANLHENYFSGMSYLKVLDLSRSVIEAIPSSMESLKKLRTLLLEYCSLKDISRISKLVNLQTLSFRESNSTRLPKEMGGLVELKLLDLSNCDQLRYIPAGVFENMSKLEALYMKGSFSNWTVTGYMTRLTELQSLPLKVLEITIQSIEQLHNKDFPVFDLSSYKIDLALSQLEKLPPRDSQVEKSSPRDFELETMSSSRDLQVGKARARDLKKEGWKTLLNRVESLHLKNIEGLRNVSPYLGEYVFKELKNIKVSACLGMKCFISIKSAYQSVVFPKLEVLCLEYLPDLVAVNKGISPPIMFSDLQKLTLSHLEGLRSFAISIQQANKLRVLEGENCENLEFIFDAFAPTKFQGKRGEATGNHEVQLPSLEKLILANLNALRSLVVVGTNTNEDDASHLLFRKIIFPSLDKMKVISLPKVDGLWDMTKGDEFAQAFPKLRSIFLENLVLNHVWSSELCKGSFSFAKLKKLKIRDCPSLKTVCPLSVAGGFEQLELLRIYLCNELEQVISTEGSTISKKGGMSFPKLLTIDLMFLSVLTHFYKGNMKMEFPILKSLELNTLLKLETFVEVEKPYTKEKLLRRMKTNVKVEKFKKKADREEKLPKDVVLFNEEVKFPCLEQLHVMSLDRIEGLWAVTAQEFSTLFPKLQSVSLMYIKELKYIWSNELTGPSYSFINLKEIYIYACHSLESWFRPSAFNGPLIVRFNEVQTVNVVSSNKFKYILQGNVNLEFPALKELQLSDLNEFKTFAKLQNCQASGGGEMDNEDEALFNKKILFPSLEELKLHSLHHVQKLWDITNYKEFNLIFPSLLTLNIENLSKLMYVWNDELEEEIEFGSLENITVSGCEDLKSLFSFTASDFPPGSQSTKVISFPKLQSLILSDLKSFECLFPKYSKMEFQALKKFTFEKLHMVKVLVKLEKCDPGMETDTDTNEASENENDSEPDEEYCAFKAKPNAEVDKEASRLEAKPNAEADTEESGLEGKPDAEPDEKGSGLEGKPNVEMDKEDSDLEVEQKAEPNKENSGLETQPNAEPNEKGSGLEGKPNAEPGKKDSDLEAEQKAEPDKEDSGLETELNAETDEKGSGLEGKPNAELEKEDYGIEAEQNAELDKEDSGRETEPNAKSDERGSGLEAESDAEEDGLTKDKALFRGNVKFSSLEELRVEYMDELEHIYKTEVCEVASSSIFPKLRTLHLTGGYQTKLKHLPKGLLHRLSSLFICRFNTLKCLVSSANVSAEIALFRSLSELKKLENLTIENCDSIENLFEVSGDQAVTLLPSLRMLELSGLHKLKQIQWHVLPNLRSLTVMDCLHDQEFLIQVPSGAEGLPLQQLEKMTVKHCKRMEAIVGRPTAIQDDGEIVFPQLKEIVLWEMLSLASFSSASCTTIRLPSLLSLNCYRCLVLKSFSLSSIVTPKLSQLEIETGFFVIDEDLNSMQQGQFNSNSVLISPEVAKYYPQKLKHKLHVEHELKLYEHRSYYCDGCGKVGMRYSFTCYCCGFNLHPRCALDESQLIEVPDEIKVCKDWPKILNNELHESHKMKLAMGRNNYCEDCYEILELYSYYCEACGFYLHPECALREDAIAKCWPQKLKHKLHEEHELKLSKYLPYDCDRCGKYGGTRYSYTCYICRFTLHPTCALDESQLLEEPDEIKVGKDWPRILKHELHKSHELELVMGRGYICNGCRGRGAQLFSYYCEKCDFDLHPRCALPDIST